MAKTKPKDVCVDCPKKGNLVVEIQDGAGKPVYNVTVTAIGPESLTKKATGKRGPSIAHFGLVTPGAYTLDLKPHQAFTGPISVMVVADNDHSATKPSAVLKLKIFSITVNSASVRFAPGTEKMDLKYTIVDPASVITSGKIEILDKTKTVVHTIKLTAAKDYANGAHDQKDWWDGDKGGGDFISFDGSPYTIRAVVSDGATEKSDSKQTKVELHSLKSMQHGDRLKKEDSAYRVYFTGNPPGRPVPMVTPATFIVEATVRFKSKADGGPLTTPVKVDLKWIFADPACDLSAVKNAKAKKYVSDALNYKKDSTTPKGDNCHLDRGGKRGDAAHQYFSAPAGFTVSADGAPSLHADAKSLTETSGTFDITIDGSTDTATIVASRHGIPEADLVSANPGLGAGPLADKSTVHLPKRGKSAIQFVTSSIGGDNYQVLVTITKAPSFKVANKVVTVWHEVTVESIKHMAACSSGVGALAGGYLSAYTRFILPAITPIPRRSPLWPYPPTHPLIRRQDFPPAPANDNVYFQTMQSDSYAAEAQFAADQRAGTAGIQLLGSHLLRRVGLPAFSNIVDGTGTVTGRQNTGGELGEGEFGGFDSINGIGLYDAPEVLASFLTGLDITMIHEMGHLLGIPHTEVNGAAHDPKDSQVSGGVGGCLMRADGNGNHFCGKCLLFLWHWTITGPALP